MWTINFGDNKPGSSIEVEEEIHTLRDRSLLLPISQRLDHIQSGQSLKKTSFNIFVHRGKNVTFTESSPWNTESRDVGESWFVLHNGHSLWDNIKHPNLSSTQHYLRVSTQPLSHKWSDNKCRHHDLRQGPRPPRLATGSTTSILTFILSTQLWLRRMSDRFEDGNGSRLRRLRSPTKVRPLYD